MSVRKHPSKSDWWIIDFYPQGRQGKRARVPFRGTELEAREWEMELRRQMKATPNQNLFPRLSEVVPDFLAHYKLDHLPKGIERTIRSLKIILKFFGKCQFTTITPPIIDQYKRQRLTEGVKPTTINKELAALSGLCKWANEKGYCPPLKIARFRAKLTKAPMPDVPTRAEILSIIDSMNWPVCGFFACLYYAGLRSTEGREMTVENIYQSMIIVRGKGNKQRVVPISDGLRPYLENRIKEVGQGRLWPVPKDLRSVLKWASKRAGVTRHITPHSFRHAFGTHATDRGISLRALQDIMGHSTSQITEIYTTLAAQVLQKEMVKF